MNETLTSSDSSNRWLVRWTFVDIALVLVYAAIGTLVLGFVVVGVGDPQTLLQDNALLLTAVAGCIVYGILLLAIYFQIVRRHRIGWSAVGFRSPPLVPLLFAPLIALGQLLTVALMNALVLAVTGQFDNPQIEAISGGQGFSWRNFLLMLLLAGVVAPVVEEVLFRGVIYGWLRARMPIILALVISAAVFAGVHFIPILLPALFVVGLILALVYEWTKSLWVAILIHAIQNSVAVVAIFVALAMEMPVST